MVLAFWLILFSLKIRRQRKRSSTKGAKATSFIYAKAKEERESGFDQKVWITSYS
jgi:hypothetical protein